MFSSGRQLRATWVSMFFMLLVGLLPPGLVNACSCGLHGCCVSAEGTREASASTQRSCCSRATSPVLQAAARGCASQDSPSRNCCCSNQLSGCVESTVGCDTDSRCSCSPVPESTTTLPTTESVPAQRAVDSAFAPTATVSAIAPPLALSPADFSASLIHAPPVPLRELFCVWHT